MDNDVRPRPEPDFSWADEGQYTPPVPVKTKTLPAARRRRPVTTVIVSLLLTVSAVVWLLLGMPGMARAVAEVKAFAGQWPSPASQAEIEAFEGIATVNADSTAFSFMGQEKQDVIAFDPCQPIHYVVREANAPDGGSRLLQEAIGRVSTATGLEFIYDGTTTEDPSHPREKFQPERYGDRWAPVLIAWTTPEESPEFQGAVAGRGGSESVKGWTSPWVRVTGQLELDAPQLAKTLQDSGGDDLVRAIMMHELGHVVGLNHVDDPDQLMYTEISNGVTEYGAGDLAGLAAAGQGVCVSEY